MRVVFINKSDLRGGAAVVTFRLVNALRAIGVDARLLVTEKLSDSPFVEVAAPRISIKTKFLLERLKIYRANGHNRATLFKIDAGAYGLPLASHPLVRQADIVCLNWINQGMLSLNGIKRIADLGKPIIWTMHDLWPMTALCHLPGNCKNFTAKCHDCQFLRYKTGDSSLSATIWKRKQQLYNSTNIRFIAVSHWVEQQCRQSSLLRNAQIDIIPNAFPIPQYIGNRNESDKIRIVMGAARLDDPVKGFPTLIATCRHLVSAYPELASKLQLITYGDIKDPQLLDQIAIDHSHLGLVHGEEAIRAIYANADIVISTSHYETFGATLVEGQAQGCIPIAFDHGGQSDIINHLANGYLAQYSDDTHIAASRLAQGINWACQQLSPSTRQRLHQSAYNNFSAHSIALKYLQIFKSIEQKR